MRACVRKNLLHALVNANFETIIPWMHVGYELLDVRLSYISSHSTSVSELIVTLGIVYVDVLNVNPCKHRDCMLLLTVSKAEFFGQFLQTARQTTGYMIYTMSRELIRLPEFQYPMFGC